MAYSKTSVPFVKGEECHVPPDATDWRETGRIAPVEDPLAPARGFMVGMACGLGFWAIVILLAMVIA